MKEMLDRELSGIEIPKELHERCMAGVRRAALQQKRQRVIKAASVAAALVICCILAANPAVSQGIRGMFRDIKGKGGAIVGTAYTAAAGELEVCLLPAGQTELEAGIAFVFPEEFPWRTIEEISLGEYRITDAEGKVLYKGTGSPKDRFPVENGKVHIPLNIDTALPGQGEYALKIDMLYGHSKADAPLEITLPE